MGEDGAMLEELVKVEGVGGMFEQYREEMVWGS